MSDGGRIIPGLDRIAAARIASSYERVRYQFVYWFIWGLCAFWIIEEAVDGRPRLQWMVDLVCAFFVGAIVAAAVAARSVRPRSVPSDKDDGAEQVGHEVPRLR